MARHVEPTLELVDLDPATAQDWLAHNTKNRRIRRSHVENLKAAIARGEWTLNGAPIVFDINDDLADGQHRLTAIAEGTTTVPVIVVSGVTPEARDTIDTTQIGRNLSDALEIRGYTNHVLLASMIVFKWKLDNDLVRTQRRPTVIQGLHVLKDHGAIVDSGGVASKVNRRVRGASSVVGALHYEFSQIDEDAADKFFDLLADPIGLSKRSPIYALRRMMETHKLSQTMLAAVIIKAWNAYLNGIDVTQLSWRPVGKAPEAFPEIEGQ